MCNNRFGGDSPGRQGTPNGTPDGQTDDDSDRTKQATKGPKTKTRTRWCRIWGTHIVSDGTNNASVENLEAEEREATRRGLGKQVQRKVEKETASSAKERNGRERGFDHK